MKYKSFVLSILVLVVSLQAYNQCLALEKETHRIINENVARTSMNNFQLTTYLSNQLGFKDGIEETLSGIEIWKLIRDGGKYEDEPAYTRSRNHFHNPLLPWDQAGLNSLLFTGQSSALWIQDQATRRSTDLGGDWSWRKARQFYFAALMGDSTDLNGVKVEEGFLSSTTIIGSKNLSVAERGKFFAWAFRALGQSMHLVEDASVPSHTRNDVHMFYNYENYVDNLRALNPARLQTLLSNPKFFSGAMFSVASLIDSDIYTGSANVAQTAGTNVGLAEYTNANFFSEDTVFKSGFPFPARSTSVSVADYNYPDPLNPGSTVKRPYFKKIADGETNGVDGYKLAGVNYLYFTRYSSVDPTVIEDTAFVPPMDDHVFDDYAGLLIPRAVGYAANLIDYFFRGTIELTLPPPANESYRYIRLKARNTTTTGEEMTNPEEIKLVVRYKQALMDPSQGKVGPEPVPPGEDGYHYLVVPLKKSITTIPKVPKAPIDLEFDLSDTPLPLWSHDVTLQVVYKGQLGNETGAVAVGRIELPSIYGDIQLALPDTGIYGITTSGLTPPGDIFKEIRVKATNIAAGTDAMSNGGIELFVQYKLADADPFNNQPTGKSPLDPESYYLRVPEINGVNTIPRGATAELVFSLSQKPLPIRATDVHIYVVYTGQIGTKTNQIAIGYRDIAEPTPIDIINNMDYVCVKTDPNPLVTTGSYLPAGSLAAINAVGTDGSGRPVRDIYPHRLKDVYLAFTPTPASSTNYSAKIPVIQPGEFGRVFVLTDYSFNVSSSETVENIADAMHDVWGLGFGSSVTTIDGVTNQEAYVNGELVDYYPPMYTERGLKSWWYTHYENPEWPDNTTCDSSGAQPNLAGPVVVEIPQ